MWVSSSSWGYPKTWIIYKEKSILMDHLGVPPWLWTYMFLLLQRAWGPTMIWSMILQSFERRLWLRWGWNMHPAARKRTHLQPFFPAFPTISGVACLGKSQAETIDFPTNTGCYPLIKWIILQSMDWPKLKPESPRFHGKISGFLRFPVKIFPKEPIHWNEDQVLRPICWG